jgi:TolB protein
MLKTFGGARMLAALVALVLTALAAPALAQPQIEVTQGLREPLPIAIPAFTGSGPPGSDIARVISDNLDRSGFFLPIDRGRVGQPLDPSVTPQFGDWKVLGAQALVVGRVSVDPDGRLRVEFRLWDVAREQYLHGEEFTAPADTWRRVAHKISDAIYTRLTGEQPYFDTRVAFVAESGGRTARQRLLGLMDQDGANPQILTRGPDMIFSPRYSASSQEITYMSLSDSGSQIYLFNLQTNRRESIGRFPGMVFAPRFSPDGRQVAFSVSSGGNTDIYVMDLRSRTARKITSDPSIDTSPSFSPNGSQIVFTSDRAGSPQLYIMNADGSGQRRLSNGGGRYSTPVWSPRGDFIAFTKESGDFHIGIMRPDGTDERILTSSYLDEGPTWAPNGRVLMFFRETRGGNPRLWTVDLTGRVLRPSAYQGGASDPAWSPLLE